jgi:hypothetical protein
MKRITAAAWAAVALASCLFVAACRSPVSDSAEPPEAAAEKAEVSLSFYLPASFESGGPSSRVLDPNTAAITLTVKGADGGRVGIGDGSRSGQVWQGSFKAVPVGVYAPGEFIVSLKGVDGTLLASGSNGAEVTVAKGSSTTVTITTKPSAAIVTTVSFNSRFDVEVPAGSSRYFRLADLPNRFNFCPTMFHPDGNAILLVLDKDGALLSDDSGKACVAKLSGPNDGYDRYWYSLETVGDVYLGVISDPTNSAPFKAEAYVCDSRKALMAYYSGWDANQAPDDHGEWTIADGGTVDVVIPPNMDYSYVFSFLNASAANPGINFPSRRPAGLSTTDPRIAMDWEDDFGLTLWGGASARYSVRIRTNDIGAGAALDGATGSAVISIPNDATPDGVFNFTLRYTVGAGSPKMSIQYRGQRVSNHGIVDLGDVPFGASWNIPLNLSNNTGRARLDLTGQITDLATGNPSTDFFINNFPAPDAGGVFTLNPYQGYGEILGINLNTRVAADEGQTGGAVVTLATNDPNAPDFTFTMRYRVGQWAPEMWLTPSAANPNSAITVNWWWNKVALPDATSFRVYRSRSWEGPYVLAGTVATTASSGPDVLDKKGNPVTPFAYVDSGLSSESLYFYRIDATLSAAHPAGKTAFTWYPNRLSTYDPAKLDAWDRSGANLSAYHDSPEISLGTQIHTKMYPMADQDFFHFHPVAGRSYVVTLSNDSLTEGMNFTMDTQTDNSPDRSGWIEVNPWGSLSRSITWECPAGFAGDEAIIIANAYDRTLGNYSIVANEVPQAAAMLDSWAMESNASVSDSGPRGITGTVHGTSLAAGATGGNSLYFDGSANVEFPSGSIPASILGNAPKYVGMWVYPEQNRNCLFYMGPEDSSMDGFARTYRFVTDGSGMLGIDRSWGTEYSSLALSLNQWNYVFSGYDGTHYYVGRIDDTGAVVTTQTLGLETSELAQGGMWIGWEANHGFGARGRIDSVSIYSMLPSETAIKGIAAASRR